MVAVPTLLRKGRKKKKSQTNLDFVYSGGDVHQAGVYVRLKLQEQV